MTLEEYLDFNIDHVTREAKDLPSGHDVRPIFSYIRGDGSVAVADVAAGLENSLTKDIMSAWCRQRLRDARATMYSLFTPAWYVVRKNPTPEIISELSRVFAREGSEGRYRDERVECIWLSVADQERTLIAMLEVKRDYKGKIRELVRVMDAGNFKHLEGRMVNFFASSGDQ